MTKKDFFRIIIKLFGLYWLISSMFSSVQFYYLFMSSTLNITSLLMSILLFMVILILFYVLIVKTDYIIDILKLTSGFDDDRIEFQNFNTKNLLMLAMILIGATMIVDNIGTFLNQLYLSIKVFLSSQSDLTTINGQSAYHFWLSLTKIILGYILLTNYPAISKFLLKITQKKE